MTSNAIFPSHKSQGIQDFSNVIPGNIPANIWIL
jgi:hypothetical protein